MNIFRCGIPGCGEYIPEDELTNVMYDDKIINICIACDDGSYKPVNGGDKFESIKKVEKIRRKRKNDE